ncbi:MAG: hypothetical protein P8Y67_12260, partial [Alphaproteobacteria bacterium]
MQKEVNRTFFWLAYAPVSSVLPLFPQYAQGKKKSVKRCEVVQIAQTKQKKKSVNLLTVSLSEMAQGKS